MELRHLRYFVAVAEELHFRRAAERLHMSQPPLSQQIRNLEEHVGATLLVRNQRRVELTAAGRAYLVRAGDILAAVEDAAREARRVQRGEVGRLDVGFVGSATYSVVPELLRAFRERFPDVGLHLRELGTTEQLRRLEDGRLDIGFLRPPGGRPGLAVGDRVPRGAAGGGCRRSRCSGSRCWPPCRRRTRWPRPASCGSRTSPARRSCS